MPDMRRRPILALVLLAILGNSSIACACSLLARDAPMNAHHSMHGDWAPDAGDRANCQSSCSGHVAGAIQSKADAVPDFYLEKTFAPTPHYDDVDYGVGPGGFSERAYPRQHSLPPLPTPVSRRDTMLD
jgi:hypothetical protein